MPDFLKSLGIKHLHVLLLQSRGRAMQCHDDMSLEPAVVTDVMRSLVSRSRALGVVLDNEMSLLMRAKAKRGRKQDLCNSCYEMLSVDSDGWVYPCAPLSGEENFNCGSIRDKPLKDIWLKSDKTKMADASASHITQVKPKEKEISRQRTPIAQYLKALFMMCYGSWPPLQTGLKKTKAMNALLYLLQWSPGFLHALFQAQR
jgi:MoaA/NifB/PqqE/SkfB family radical SAM enzyme